MGLINAILFVDHIKKVSDSFDHTNHDIRPLNKHPFYGFADKKIRIIRNYLSQRRQMTLVNNVLSNHSSVIPGVPQKKIIGLCMAFSFIYKRFIVLF